MATQLPCEWSNLVWSCVDAKENCPMSSWNNYIDPALYPDYGEYRIWTHPNLISSMPHVVLFFRLRITDFPGCKRQYIAVAPDSMYNSYGERSCNHYSFLISFERALLSPKFVLVNTLIFKSVLYWQPRACPRSLYHGQRDKKFIPIFRMLLLFTSNRRMN